MNLILSKQKRVFWCCCNSCSDEILTRSVKYLASVYPYFEIIMASTRNNKIMDDILAQETTIARKLEELRLHKIELMRRNGKNYQTLKDIVKPPDSSVQARHHREFAISRNADFLQELVISAGKLHTKRLCPMHEKLNVLKSNFTASQVQV